MLPCLGSLAVQGLVQDRNAQTADFAKFALRATAFVSGKPKRCIAIFLKLPLAYNLGVFLQGIDLPEEVADWSLTSIQSHLIKFGIRGVRHARKIMFQMAEVAVNRPLFGQIITAIRNIKQPPRPA